MFFEYKFLLKQYDIIFLQGTELMKNTNISIETSKNALGEAGNTMFEIVNYIQQSFKNIDDALEKESKDLPDSISNCVKK